METIRQIPFEEVRSYMDHGFEITTFKAYRPDGDCEDTMVIRCGSYDGEYIDLFDLQRWFDENREWIDGLKNENTDK